MSCWSTSPGFCSGLTAKSLRASIISIVLSRWPCHWTKGAARGLLCRDYYRVLSATLCVCPRILLASTTEGSGNVAILLCRLCREMHNRARGIGVCFAFVFVLYIFRSAAHTCEADLCRIFGLFCLHGVLGSLVRFRDSTVIPQVHMNSDTRALHITYQRHEYTLLSTRPAQNIWALCSVSSRDQTLLITKEGHPT